MTGLVLASLLPSAVASASFLGMELSMRDEVLVTELTVDGYPGRRYPVPFDPAFMDAELEEAWVASPTGGRIDVPAWAVDTLSVVSGMPSALVVAFPGAMGRAASSAPRSRTGVPPGAVAHGSTSPPRSGPTASG